MKLKDLEAEAEAVASAVAVTTISSDDLIGNGWGVGFASVVDTKSYGGDVSILSTGGMCLFLTLIKQMKVSYFDTT